MTGADMEHVDLRCVWAARRVFGPGASLVRGPESGTVALSGPHWEGYRAYSEVRMLRCLEWQRDGAGLTSHGASEVFRALEAADAFRGHANEMPGHSFVVAPGEEGLLVWAEVSEIYPTANSALRAGWPGAEWGWWNNPRGTSETSEMRWGWCPLTREKATPKEARP